MNPSRRFFFLLRPAARPGICRAGDRLACVHAAGRAACGAVAAWMWAAASAIAPAAAAAQEEDIALRHAGTQMAGVSNLEPDSARLTGVSRRWWLGSGPSDGPGLGVGLGVGAVSLSARPLGAAPGEAGMVLRTAPSVDIAMSYRPTSRSLVFADASRLHGFGPDNGDAYVGKVGVEWRPASLASRWNLSYGGIGWRLDSGARMTLRVRSGGIGLYVRSQF
jgi:hypothetical protein